MRFVERISMRTVVEIISMIAAVAAAVAAFMSWSTASALNTGTFIQLLADQVEKVSNANAQQPGDRCSELLDNILVSDPEMSKIVNPTMEFRNSFPRDKKGDPKIYNDQMMACLKKAPTDSAKVQLQEMRSLSDEYIAKSLNVYETALRMIYAAKQALKPDMSNEVICSAFPPDPYIYRIAQELSKSDPTSFNGILQLGCWKPANPKEG